MDILILISWVFFSFLVAAVAGEKGHNGTGYLFLSLLFSPVIGLIAALLAETTPEEKARREQKRIDAGAMKRCPACAEAVKPQAAVCRYCGHAFAPGAAPSSPLPNS